MSELPTTISESILWSIRIAAVGVMFAALSASASLIGIDSIGLLYWPGILLAICGVSVAAIRGGQYSGFPYTGGVLSAMAGVLILGYGVDSQRILPMLAGIAILVSGAFFAIVNTRRTS